MFTLIHDVIIFRMFRRAIVKKPAETFADGLTTVDFGNPEIPKTLLQHQKYCEALETCGLELTYLEADAPFPDSTFVEDTAILTPRNAILTNPGANSRKGEVASIREALSSFYPRFDIILPPGTVDGGDVCEASSHFFIGISERTNEEGRIQLSGFLEKQGYTSSLVDIREIKGILHLKSGIAYLGDGNLVVADELAQRKEFKRYHILHVDEEENYAANCLRVNDRVLFAAGYPKLQKSVEELGCSTILLDMSEFRKMDGGLSCLSLRF